MLVQRGPDVEESLVGIGDTIRIMNLKEGDEEQDDAYQRNTSDSHTYPAEVVGGYPPMLPYPSALQPNPHQMTSYYPPYPDGYSMPGHMPHPAGGYVPPQAAPMPPPPQYYYPPQAPPQQMYYGSWPGSAAPPISQQVQYMSYPVLPPQNPRHNGGSSKKPDEYGSLELNSFEAKDEKFFSALNFVRRNPKATLYDIDGIIPDIAKYDEDSSRFIQKRLRLGTIDERRLGLKAALSSLDELWTDQYGNFLLQGIFEFGTHDMKRELMDALYQQDVEALCLHIYGCRVIQKAIRSLEQEEVCILITEFHGKVLMFIHNPNGNHVIQKCIQVMSFLAKTAATSGDPVLAFSLSDKMQFIIDDIVAYIETLSTHRYGCRVIQRAIEHCSDYQKNAVLDNVMSCHDKLVDNQYGNYVVQQVLVCGNEAHQEAILETLTHDGSLLEFSKHKYASNVVEAVLARGEPQHKNKILEEMLKDPRGVIELSKDPIANYVVGKAIEVSEGEQKEKFCELISSNRSELSNSPYAKYVLQRISKQRNKS